MRFDHLGCIGQQQLGIGCTGHHCRAGGKGDEGMQVGGLAAVFLAAGMGEPATVAGVLHGPTQGGHTVFGIGQAAGNALQMGQGEAVGHSRGIHGFGAGAGRELAFGIQVAKAVGQFRGFGECQQALRFGQAPGGVGRGIEPAVSGQVEGNHGPA
ncbi:hypothetical protein D9M71_399000 [compost metagenome]